MKKLITLSAVFVMLALLVWPVFVLTSLFISYLAGEGSIVNTWYLEPKRNVLAHLLEGYKNSAIIAAIVAIVALLLGAVHRQYKALRLAVFVILPLAGVVLANYFYTDSQSVQLAFISTGVVLAIISFLVSGAARRIVR